MNEADSEINQQPFNSTILLICKQKDLPYLPQWLSEKYGSEIIRNAPLLVIVDGAAPTSTANMFRDDENASLIELPYDDSWSKTLLADAYSRIFQTVKTPYIHIQRLSKKKKDSPSSLARRFYSSRAPLPTAPNSYGIPVLIPTSQMDKIASRAYLRFVIKSAAKSSPEWQEYLTFINLMVASASLEATDPIQKTRSVKVHIRLHSGRFNNEERPFWRYELVVMANRSIVARADLRPDVWTDSAGNTRWEALVGEIPLDEIPDGDFELAISRAGSAKLQKPLTRSLRPRPGATTPARIIRNTSTNPHITYRYLVHTTGRATTTWLSKQTGSEKSAQKLWKKRLIKKNLRAILRRDGGWAITRALILYQLTKPLFRKRQVWLIGERADTAQDNGLHLFHYLRTKWSDKEVYYVIDKDSPHYTRIAHLGNVVEFSSLKHRLLTLHASVLANAYSLAHMVPAQWQNRKYFLYISWRTRALRVYLKHGINTGVNALQRGTNGYDVYITASDRETSAVLENSGYNNEVAETGLARFDALRKIQNEEKTILFMPTWRRYLVPKLFGNEEDAVSQIAGSDYEKGILSLLEHERTRALLKESGYRLKFLPHYNAKHHFLMTPLRNPYVEILDDQDVEIQKELRECSIFVTDYSSVHFDVAYIGTPLIYYQFDVAEFSRRHASESWFNFQKDGFGKVAYSLNEVHTELTRLIDNGANRSRIYDQRVDHLFTFVDHGNCARIVAAIQARLANVNGYSS